ncbi:MAG TPA: NAD(P)H-binding protein, partial [Puia sp.]|nr:NAD(P)H-binding protein [Puia sp.]
MKIIVTGSLGHIGRPLTEQLVKKGHEVTVISSKPEKQSAIETLGARAAIGSVEDVEFLTTAFTGADVVYCMLPPGGFFDPGFDLMTKVAQLAQNYKQAIAGSGVRK